MFIRCHLAIMSLHDLSWKIPVVVIGGFSGMAFHELCHYVLGYLSGGRPFFDRFWFGIPTQVDFREPSSMSPAQVRMTGGIVILWPILTFSCLGYIIGSGKMGLLLVIPFFAGASVVSWLDLLATYYPKLWQKFTEGESICREDL